MKINSKEDVSFLVLGLAILIISPALNFFFGLSLDGKHAYLWINLLIVFLVNLFELAGNIIKLNLHYNSDSAFFKVFSDDAESFGMIVFGFYQSYVCAISMAFIVNWAGAVSVVLFIFFTKILFYLFFVFTPAGRGLCARYLKKMSSRGAMFFDVITTIAIYFYSYFLIYVITIFCRKNFHTMETAYFLWLALFMVITLAPLQFPYLFVRSLSVRSWRERVLFLISVLWIGLSAGANIYFTLK